MNAQIASASSFTSRRHRMARWMGKAGPIYVAVVIVVVGALIASQMLTRRTGLTVDQDDQGVHTSKFLEVNTAFMPAASTAVSTSEYYDDLMAQQDAFFHRTVDTATYYDELMAQQEQFIARAASLSVVTSDLAPNERRAARAGITAANRATGTTSQL
jgi:hypothetical protein